MTHFPKKLLILELLLSTFSSYNFHFWVLFRGGPPSPRQGFPPPGAVGLGRVDPRPLKQRSFSSGDSDDVVQLGQRGSSSAYSELVCGGSEAGELLWFPVG